MPGINASPPASITVLAGALMLPIPDIFPSATATSPVNRGAPVPSMIEAPRMRRSSMPVPAGRILPELAGTIAATVEQKTLGRYKILGELGRGAMGAVYRAVDPLIEREVAIKTLLPNLPPEVMDEVRERFIREARSAGRLNHPNIVTVFDVGEHEGVAYIAMELLEGHSLQQVMKDTRLSYDAIADLVAQVADALDAAYQ